MADVTAALDTWRAAAIAGSEARKILVASVAVAANAQITAMQAGIDRCSNPGAETSLGTYSVMVRALKSFIKCETDGSPAILKLDAARRFLSVRLQLSRLCGCLELGCLG